MRRGSGEGPEQTSGRRDRGHYMLGVTLLLHGWPGTQVTRALPSWA